MAPFIEDSLVPEKRRYLLWGLLRTFRRDYTLVALTLFVEAAASLTAPYALQNLLKYIGTKGEGAEIRPWGVLLILVISRNTNAHIRQSGSLSSSWHLRLTLLCLSNITG